MPATASAVESRAFMAPPRRCPSASQMLASGLRIVATEHDERTAHGSRRERRACDEEIQVRRNTRARARLVPNGVRQTMRRNVRGHGSSQCESGPSPASKSARYVAASDARMARHAAPQRARGLASSAASARPNRPLAVRGTSRAGARSESACSASREYQAPSA